MENKAVKKILMIEDDEGLVSAVKTLLESCGYRFLAAYDGTIGTSYAASAHPDAILLDLGLPAGGGFFVLENLRASAETSNIPVVVITAHTEKELEEKARRMGVAAFIRKPFDPPMLVEKIKEIIGGCTLQ
jgi:DNA-binding response OmpR family regulator